MRCYQNGWLRCDERSFEDEHEAAIHGRYLIEHSLSQAILAGNGYEVRRQVRDLIRRDRRVRRLAREEEGPLSLDTRRLLIEVGRFAIGEDQ